MTVIAAIADGQRVWMAADTGVPSGGLMGGSVRKVRRLKLADGAQVLVGVTGAAGLMRVAQTALASGVKPTPMDLRPSGYTDLDDWALRLAAHLTTAAADAVPPLTEPDPDGMVCASGSWLLGYAGRLWHLHTHSAVPVPGGVAAIGVGAGVALGWLLALRSGDPGQVVAGAVLAACSVVPFCSAPEGPVVEVLHPF